MCSSLACVMGIISHVGYLSRGEHHNNGAFYLISFLALYVCVMSCLNGVLGYVAGDAWKLATLYCAVYLAGLYSSLLTYRLALNPLNKIAPRPWGARISDLWPVWALLTRHKGRRETFKLLQDMHDRYGDIVRLGPNMVSVIRSDAMQAIHGMKTTCKKSHFYDLNKPWVSIHTTRVKQVHEQRRRVWSGAFGERQLRGYEERIVGWQNKLISRLKISTKDTGSAVLDVRNLMDLYTYDVMGDLSFGRSFDMLETSREHHAIRMLRNFMTPMGFVLPHWLFRIILAIPRAAKDWFDFMDYCGKQLEDRLQVRACSSYLEKPPLTSTENPFQARCALFAAQAIRRSTTARCRHADVTRGYTVDPCCRKVS